MLADTDEVAVIDYQDARVGAITYDLASLLRDCYIAFDPVEIEKLALTFRDKKGLDIDDATFIRWFDFMGLQRHIKVLGIFARLHLRDGKDAYLDDIPQTLKYVKEVSAKYEEMRPLLNLFEKLGVQNESNDTGRRIRNTDASFDRPYTETTFGDRGYSSDCLAY